MNPKLPNHCTTASLSWSAHKGVVVMVVDGVAVVVVVVVVVVVSDSHFPNDFLS